MVACLFNDPLEFNTPFPVQELNSTKYSEYDFCGLKFNILPLGPAQPNSKNKGINAKRIIQS